MSDANAAAAAPAGARPVLRAIGALSTLAGWIAAAMLLAAVAITCQMIVVRFVLNQSTIWQTEAVIYLVVASTLLGLSWVQKQRGHVNVDLVPIAMKGRARLWLAVATLLVVIAVTLALFWWGIEFWHFAWKRGWKSPTVWAPPLWIPYLAIPVGFGLLLLQLLADLAALLLRIDRPFGLKED